MRIESKNWTSSTLTEITSLIKDGSHGTHVDVEGGIPFLSAKDVRNGSLRIPDDCRRISKIDYSIIHKNYDIKQNDILLTIVGTIGRCCLIKEREKKFSIQRSVAVIRSQKVTAEYLYQYISFQKFQRSLYDFVNASAQGGVYLGSLAKCEINYPVEKIEQTKIAEVLSTADRVIEQTEALIAKQQHIKTGLMQDLLTRGIDEHGNLRSEATHEFKDSPLGRIPVEWEVKPIELMLKKIIDYRGRTPTKVEAGTPLLTAKNVRDGYLNEEPREFIVDNAYEKWMTRGIPVWGDVLFTTEAPMGNVARVPNYRIALAQRLLTLCPKEERLTQDYLFWMLHWQRTTERIELLTSGSTVTGVKQSVFRKILFCFPPKDEQKRISNILNLHNVSSKNEKSRVEKLCLIKTSLMQDLLTGKKRVTPLLEPENSQTS